MPGVSFPLILRIEYLLSVRFVTRNTSGVNWDGSLRTSVGLWLMTAATGQVTHGSIHNSELTVQRSPGCALRLAKSYSSFSKFCLLTFDGFEPNAGWTLLRPHVKLHRILTLAVVLDSRIYCHLGGSSDSNGVSESSKRTDSE